MLLAVANVTRVLVAERWRLAAQPRTETPLGQVPRACVGQASPQLWRRTRFERRRAERRALVFLL